MAVTKSVGYVGKVTGADWPALAAAIERKHFLGNEWKVTVVAGADRTVAVTAGKGYQDGVLDYSDGVGDTVQMAAPGSGTVWHTVVARRNWSTKVTSFASVAGGTAAVIAAGLKATPGVESDQVLALVPVTAGQQLAGTPIDLRDTGVRSMTFARPTGTVSDSYASGVMQSLISGTWTDAPAGKYRVRTNLILSGTASAVGNLRVSADGVNVSSDERYDVSTVALGQPRWHEFTRANPGSLSLTVSHQASTGTVTIVNRGSQAVIEWLGAA